MLDMGKRDMLDAAGAGEGILGNLARQTEMSPGFQGMDMQAGDKQLSEFSKDFAKKYYHSNVDKDKYSSYTDWVNTSPLMQNIEGAGLSVKMEEEEGKPAAFLDYGDKSIDMKMFQDAANLRDEDFQDKNTGKDEVLELKKVFLKLKECPNVVNKWFCVDCQPSNHYDEARCHDGEVA